MEDFEDFILDNKTVAGIIIGAASLVILCAYFLSNAQVCEVYMDQTTNTTKALHQSMENCVIYGVHRNWQT